MMDPKYFGENSKIIKICRKDIDNLILLLNLHPSPFKLKLFGVPPENYYNSHFIDSDVQECLA